MDVVRSEAQALGGRVGIGTDGRPGHRFPIHLPLTLAVTQVVLVASGASTYALPPILVEQVLQVREAGLDARQPLPSLQVEALRRTICPRCCTRRTAPARSALARRC